MRALFTILVAAVVLFPLTADAAIVNSPGGGATIREGMNQGADGEAEIVWWCDLNAPSFGSAAVGDIDRDGKLEIVFGALSCGATILVAVMMPPRRYSMLIWTVSWRWWCRPLLRAEFTASMEPPEM